MEKKQKIWKSKILHEATVRGLDFEIESVKKDINEMRPTIVKYELNKERLKILQKLRRDILGKKVDNEEIPSDDLYEIKDGKLRLDSLSLKDIAINIIKGHLSQHYFAYNEEYIKLLKEYPINDMELQNFDYAEGSFHSALSQAKKHLYENYDDYVYFKRKINGEYKQGFGRVKHNCRANHEYQNDEYIVIEK